LKIAEFFAGCPPGEGNIVALAVRAFELDFHCVLNEIGGAIFVDLEPKWSMTRGGGGSFRRCQVD